jgi:pimeloyl-ACP methyl ester carboxylesterase
MEEVTGMQNDIHEKTGLYYRTNEFRSDRQTLVFIHGVTGSSSAWKKYEAAFKDTYNILTFDLRGHGKSKKYKRYEDYSIHTFSEDIVAMLSDLAINKFVLVSHSFGTIIAVDFLRKHQTRVTKAVFLSPIGNLKQMRWSRLIHEVSLLLALLYRFWPFYRSHGSQIDYSRFPNSGDWNVPRLLADLSNTGLRIFLYCFIHLYYYSHEQYWSRVTVPSLILHGKKDTISSVHAAEKIASEIERSDLVLLEQANHILVLNNFEEVSSQLKKFI